MNMHDLKIFFLILFLGETVILTPTPISIGSEEISISLSENISAITIGATLQIDVTTMINFESKPDVIQIRTDAETQFPKGAITATLSNSKDSEITLTYHGGLLVNDDRVRLVLEGSVPLKMEWDRIKITSDVELQNVTVMWVNAKH